MTDTEPGTQANESGPAEDGNPAGTVRDESFVIVASRVGTAGAAGIAPPPPIVNG